MVIGVEEKKNAGTVRVEIKVKPESGKAPGRGTLCDVCTGCGRCPGVAKNVRVVTASGLALPRVSMENKDGKRLAAVDIGTTTIAMQLYDGKGEIVDGYVCVNPQTAYGADVMSRIERAKEMPVRESMRQMVLSELKKGYMQFMGRLSEGESLFAVLAANTTMVYLLLGLDPGELGEYPFHASHLEGVHQKIAGVETVIFPGLSAFVGGDITAGLFACGVTDSVSQTLFIDLGTNGEIALGNREKIVCCGTAAGPAFEGGVNRGIWGSDMLDILSELYSGGMMDETGLLAEEYFDNGIRIGNVRITQPAIRAIQLAKAAIAAGIRILTKKRGIAFAEVDRIILAGGFGYFLNPESALSLGLFGNGMSVDEERAKECLKKIKSSGNTALLGAYKLGSEILSGKRKVMTGAASGLLEKTPVEVVNLADTDEFNEIYMNEINFV